MNKSNRDSGSKSVSEGKINDEGKSKVSNVLKAVKKAREVAKPRKFEQSIDMIVSLKGLDLKKPENRFSSDIVLPHAASRNVKVCVVGDTLKATSADRVISSKKLKDFADRDLGRKLAEEYDFFIAEAPLMPEIGRVLGPVLGPKNKMPRPVPPNTDISKKLEEFRKTVCIKLADNPSLQVKIGHEKMMDKDLEENITLVLNHLKERLPAGENNIKNILVKLTMGPSVRVER